MIIAIICLIIGVLGFVKGRINVSKKRELRGAPMYIVATLFCLPLPLSFLAGVAVGAAHAAQGTPIDQSTLVIIGAVTTGAPLVLALVLGFALSTAKDAPAAPRAQGFEVKV
jgi:hypothetical protein